MPDSRIRDLPKVQGISNSDLFVLEQNAQAKALSGQVLVTWLTNFADGHGGIQSITKTSTVGLVDTYTIVFADASKYNYQVRNGEKGDTGDQTYVWIRYASENPGAATPIKTEPDDWMGIYAGLESSAPETASAYTWYQIKGRQGGKGDKGDAGITYSIQLSYGASRSTTSYPTAWYSSITSVPATSGDYIWTRSQYVSDGTVAFTGYSVSHIGRDGTGAGTVNTVTFGGTTYTETGGDVSIPMPTATDVGAIAEPEAKSDGQFLAYDGNAGKWMAATPQGAVQTVNGVGVTEGTTNIELTQTKLGISNPNLLDNPWFTVNQRGKTEYGTSDGLYTVDRWKRTNAQSPVTVNVENGETYLHCVSNTDGTAHDQYFEVSPPPGTYTVSMILRNGTSYVGFQLRYDTDVFDDPILFNTTDEWAIYSASVTVNEGLKAIRFRSDTAGASYDIKAIKFEHGNQSTLANDHAPDYATELMKCQRYFLNLSAEYELFSGMISSDAKSYFLFLPTPVTMRTTPVVSNTRCVIRGVTGYSSLTPNSTAVAIAFRATSISSNGIALQYDSKTADRITNNTPLIVNIKPGAMFSADL